MLSNKLRCCNFDCCYWCAAWCCVCMSSLNPSHCHHGIWHPLVGFVTQSAMYGSSVIDTTNILSLETLFIDEDGPSISAAWACHRGWTTVSKFTVLCFPDILVSFWRGCFAVINKEWNGCLVLLTRYTHKLVFVLTDLQLSDFFVLHNDAKVGDTLTNFFFQAAFQLQGTTALLIGLHGLGITCQRTVLIFPV